MAKKIKKALKNVAKVALPAAAIAMMMRGGKGSDKFLASGAAGGQRLPKGDMMARARKLMTQNNAMRNSMLQNAPVTADDLIEYDASQPFGFGLMAKKGGRIVKGKKAAVRTTKGFSKTKKKQANKMRKK